MESRNFDFNGSSNSNGDYNGYKKLSDAEQINRYIDELQEYEIEEAVTHFLPKKCKDVRDEARYFNKKDQLNKFIEAFKKEGGKIENLHIGETYDDDGKRFLGWEICRMKYWIKNREIFEAVK